MLVQEQFGLSPAEGHAGGFHEVKTRVQKLRDRVLSPMFGEMKQAAEVHSHVRNLILKTGPQASKCDTSWDPLRSGRRI